MCNGMHRKRLNIHVYIYIYIYLGLDPYGKAKGVCPTGCRSATRTLHRPVAPRIAWAGGKPLGHRCVAPVRRRDDGGQGLAAVSKSMYGMTALHTGAEQPVTGKAITSPLCGPSGEFGIAAIKGIGAGLFGQTQCRGPRVR